MCILFIAVNQHPKYPLVVCANRDEFHQRATQEMHLWQAKKILAGKDLQAGGTWLGVNHKGQFSALTNYRRPAHFDENKKSRGDLVINALTLPSDTFLKTLKKSAHQYNDFNLLVGDEKQLSCFNSVTNEIHQLNSGAFSLCNGALNDIWPKMRSGQQALAKALQNASENNKPIDIEQLFAIMTDNNQADLTQLPKTGISQQWELLLSSIFIKSPKYGTRSTSIFIKEHTGKFSLYERSFNRQGNAVNTLNFSQSSFV